VIAVLQHLKTGLGDTATGTTLRARVAAARCLVLTR
jgi:hypothetical protein